ncbi:MAG: hypothetical protein SFZ03_07225 [Candidatus Melainabacteria bacterium]|nr:hypothetical protein [Candidatus Melainabacteria bacterium]
MNNHYNFGFPSQQPNVYFGAHGRRSKQDNFRNKQQRVVGVTTPPDVQITPEGKVKNPVNVDALLNLLRRKKPR